MRGVLLLAEGSKITPEFKRLLRQRSISSVQLHTEDAANLTVGDASEDLSEHGGFDNELTRKLDEAIDSGPLVVVNSDKALREQQISHGCSDYDVRKWVELDQKTKQTRHSVSSVMQEVLHGKGIASATVASLAASYLSDMTDDLDSVVSTVFKASGEEKLADHCLRMSLMGMAIGVEMGLDAHNVRQVGLAGLVHDWGMARIPPELRSAKRKLTETEFFEIQKHPIYSLALLERMPGISSQVSLTAYQVHERPNGCGYPRGRTGDRIHPFAKILNVADAYTALVSPRPFRPPLMPYAAMECLLRQAQSRDVDPHVLRAFLHLMTLFPIGSYVVLDDGSVAQVLRSNGSKFLQPMVRIVQTPSGKMIAPGTESAVLDLSREHVQVVQALPTPGTNEISLVEDLVDLGRKNGASVRSGRDAASALEVAEAYGLNSNANGPLGQQPSLETYTERQKLSVVKVLEMLDRCSSRHAKHAVENRKHDRKPFRRTVSICVPEPENPIVGFQQENAFRAVSRNVSQGGLSFIHPAELPLADVFIGLSFTGDDVKWFQARIVRSREIEEEGFWEYGVAFRRRVSD
jgi:HD-GYP domain-containing protein (c-di-GMP phosphodiesterase class II)